jgi:hypothetical protein
MSSSSNNNNNNNNEVAGVRARPEQAREKRRRRPTRDTQWRQQRRQQWQQVLQDLADLQFDDDQSLIWWLRHGPVLTQALGCLEDLDRGGPDVDKARDLALTMLHRLGRVIFDAYGGPDHLAFRRDSLRAQLDKIRKILEMAMSNIDLSGVAVAVALAMLDHVDGGPGRQEAESSAPPQAAV